MFKPKRKSRKWLLLKFVIAVGLVSSFILAGFFYYLRSEVKHRFSSRIWSIPSRVFSATVPIYPGQALSLSQLKQMLDERRYQPGIEEPLRAGEYKISKGSLTVNLREFQFPGHTLPARRVRFDFQQNRLASIEDAQGGVGFLELEPVEIDRLFGPERESRLLISIKQVPKHLVDAVLAIEDHRFYEHPGVDWWGILRAFMADVRARKVVQGGSTITQQLVKNYFLEPERNLKRKLLEASMALVLESMYGKDQILEMYLNEIYLGQRGSVAIDGVGEAARYYFGRNVEDLTLAECATLAGLIRAPNLYSPIGHPRATLERRNVVLKRMLDLNKISDAQYEKARVEPVRVAENILPLKVAPYFVDYVRHQLQELYSPDVLESEGLNIYTTLNPEMALAARNAVDEGLKDLEKSISHRSKSSSPDQPLQAVLIAVQPKTGAVLALIGGGDYSESNFNRALYAHRQPGSAIKPFVYLSALDRFTPVSQLPDEPTAFSVGGKEWTPRNFDNRYQGHVTLREALEDSINVPTVNLALSVGLDKVMATIHSLGIESHLEPVPSLALGAFEVTPIELAGAYTVLDNDGQKPFLLSLKEVVTEKGDVLDRRNVDFATVTTPAKAYLITDILQGVVQRGTAKSLKRLGIDFPCAGKTGTTSDYRDSWFVGYTTDLLALVWVGYDDNHSTHLTGATGAARIWARFLDQVRPWIHPQQFRIPPGVVQRMVCLDSGKLATMSCAHKSLEVFLSDNVPGDYCGDHSN
jgi:penicillin-binding protein 1B